MAEKDNSTASALVTAIGDKPLTEFEIISDQPQSPPSSEPLLQTTPSQSELSLIAEGIEIAAKWMEEAGVHPAVIAHWKLTELSKQVPSLGSVISSAQTVIAQNVNSPTGMIPSQLAAKVSQQLERKVMAARVNEALHDLKLQDWAMAGC